MKEVSEAKDFPFEEVCKTAEEKINAGWTAYQKFTCEKCGSRQTMATPNVFYTSGLCEECSHETDLKKAGCNLMLISSRT